MTPCFAGIDVGSTTTKVVLVGESGDVLGVALNPTGIDFARAAQSTLDQALKRAGLGPEDVSASVATGYGRSHAGADRCITEISCHARAGFALAGEACSVLDIGGQDTKVIQVQEGGGLGQFRMNRKCAAGTGAFLEEMARRLGYSLEELNQEADRTRDAVKLSSFCTVFAMTELLKCIQSGASSQSLARGVFDSMVTRTMEMAQLKGRVVATGGVVQHNPVFVQMLAERAGVQVEVAPKAQHAGALGAALLARARREKRRGIGSQSTATPPGEEI